MSVNSIDTCGILIQFPVTSIPCQYLNKSLVYKEFKEKQDS